MNAHQEAVWFERQMYDAEGQPALHGVMLKLRERLRQPDRRAGDNLRAALRGRLVARGCGVAFLDLLDELVEADEWP